MLAIRGSVSINAAVERVWEKFVDLSCWGDWCTALTGMRAIGGRGFGRGGQLSFRISPIVFPVRVSPVVEEFDPYRRITWRASRLGLHARHEFRFRPNGSGMVLESHEEFRGPMLRVLGPLFPKRTIHRITMRLLEEIRREAENAED